MKRYIKPEMTVLELDIKESLLAGSDPTYAIESKESNEMDLGKKHTFDVWGLDEDED